MAITHTPVLVEEVLQFLQVVPEGVYLDTTLGEGGHAKAILQQDPKVRLIGIDRDSVALERAHQHLAVFGQRFQAFCSWFSVFPEVLVKAGVKELNGILLDLGVSSLQLDTGSRGFSFRLEGPLDMRMGNTEETLMSRLGNTNVRTLAEVLEKFGEERRAKKIAVAILSAFHQGKIQTTLGLANVVAACAPSGQRWKGRIHPATRTFQALRIWINEELKELSQILEMAPGYLAPKGRFVVLSYHSLEDRLVKHAFRRSGMNGPFSVVTKKPVVPTEEEIARNPRARSAKLRALERKAT